MDAGPREEKQLHEEDGPPSLDVLPRLLETFAERIGRGPARSIDALPPLRFPQLPVGPLGQAISSDPAPRRWQDYLADMPRPHASRLLDFGCGAVEHREAIKRLGYDWHGLTTRQAHAPNSNVITVYDGLRAPLDSGLFGVVLAVQCLHRSPDPVVTVSELARLLKPGGTLVGSVPHVAPAFHSDGAFSCSPSAFAELIDAHGFTLLDVSPGIDGLTLLCRRLAQRFGADGDVSAVNEFFSEISPLNAILDECGRKQRVDPRRANALKLELGGQFHFRACKRRHADET
jgi:SAM-dependent methyltransferase